MRDFRASLPQGTPQDIAEQVLQFALSAEEGARGDMTVPTAGIWERG